MQDPVGSSAVDLRSPSNMFPESQCANRSVMHEQTLGAAAGCRAKDPSGRCCCEIF